jgi:hypothetical protein
MKRITMDVYADPCEAINWVAEHLAGKHWSKDEAQSVRDFMESLLWSGTENLRRVQRWRVEDAALTILSQSSKAGSLYRETMRTVEKVYPPHDRSHFVDAARQLRRIADMLDRKANAP